MVYLDFRLPEVDCSSIEDDIDFTLWTPTSIPTTN